MAMHAEHARMPERRDPYLELVEMINDPSRYPCQHGLTDNPDLINDARRLRANAFLQRGYIKENDIDENGFSEKIDGYWQNSDFFVVTNNDSVVASSRQIKPDERGFESFQFFEEAGDSSGLSTSDFKDFDPNKCVEISGLVKGKGIPKIATFHLYRDMLRHSRNEGHQLWFMTTTQSTYGLLSSLFDGAIQRVGDAVPKPEYHVEFFPTILDPNQAYEIFKNRKIDNSPGAQDVYNATVRFFADLDTKPDRIA